MSIIADEGLPHNYRHYLYLTLPSFPIICITTLTLTELRTQSCDDSVVIWLPCIKPTYFLPRTSDPIRELTYRPLIRFRTFISFIFDRTRSAQWSRIIVSSWTKKTAIAVLRKKLGRKWADQWIRGWDATWYVGLMDELFFARWREERN